MSPGIRFFDNHYMRNLLAGLSVFTVFSVLAFILVLRAPRLNELDSYGRGPSSFPQVVQAVSQIEQDIENPKIFNSRTAAEYIQNWAGLAYDMRSVDFVPQGESELRDFHNQGRQLASSLFRIRLKLAERLRSFEDSADWNEAHGQNQKRKTIEAFRLGLLYLRYAEDYVIQQWNQVSPLRNGARFFAGEGPLTLVNPAFADRNGRFQLKAGDIILVRGSSFFSATISRIGDVPANMSHSAMVVETENGTLRVVEALLEKNLVSYSIDEYLELERLPRAAVYRYQDADIARRAGQEGWRFYQSQLADPVVFDILMNAYDHKKVYCFEYAMIAFERATQGRGGEFVRIPRYNTSMKRVARTDFARSTGVTTQELAAPADIEIDSRFHLVAEHRDLEMLEESRRFDVVLSKLFELFTSGYTYRADVGADISAIAGVFARKFGFLKDKVPEGVSVGQFAALIRHKNLVTELMETLGEAERDFTHRTGLPISYRESAELFDRVCGTRCVREKSRDVNTRRLAEERPRAIRVGGRCELLFQPAF